MTQVQLPLIKSPYAQCVMGFQARQCPEAAIKKVDGWPVCVGHLPQELRRQNCHVEDV